MHDSEKDYPTNHTPRQDSDIHDDDYHAEGQEVVLPPLPEGKLPFALLTGIGGGILLTIISVVLTLANAPAYQEAVRQDTHMSLNTAYLLTGLNCLSYLIAMVACFLVGFFIAKNVVRRLLGFYAGALTGAIAYLGGIVVQYIPNYPSHITSNTTLNPAGGLFIDILVLIIWALIGGLFGLWGARTATKQHPYYLAKIALAEQADEQD